jgi:hypothetical protein
VALKEARAVLPEKQLIGQMGACLEAPFFQYLSLAHPPISTLTLAKGPWKPTFSFIAVSIPPSTAPKKRSARQRTLALTFCIRQAAPTIPPTLGTATVFARSVLAALDDRLSRACLADILSCDSDRFLDD